MTDLKLDEATIALIRDRVAKGEYEDASAVVREGLRLLQLRETRARLDHLLAEAGAQYDRGEYQTWSPATMDAIVNDVDENERLGIKIDIDPDVI